MSKLLQIACVTAIAAIAVYTAKRNTAKEVNAVNKTPARPEEKHQQRMNNIAGGDKNIVEAMDIIGKSLL